MSTYSIREIYNKKIKKKLDKVINYVYNIICVGNRGVAQFGRVLGLGPRCRRFKSCRLDQKKRHFSTKKNVFFSAKFAYAS